MRLPIKKNWFLHQNEEGVTDDQENPWEPQLIDHSRGNNRDKSAKTSPQTQACISQHQSYHLSHNTDNVIRGVFVFPYLHDYS